MGGAVLYFLSFLQLILILSGVYLAGYVFTRIFKRIEFVQGICALLFVRLLVGLIVIVTLYSMFRTGGVTVNLGFLFLIAAFLFELRKSKNTGSKQIRLNPQQWAGIFIAALFIFLWFATLIIRSDEGFQYYLADKDKVYYAGIAEMLSTGQENRAGVNNSIDGYYHGVSPYHYFELWITNIASLVTGKPTVVCLYLFVYPLLCIVSMLGLLAIIEKFAMIKWWHPLLSILLLFAGGTRFHFSDPGFIFTINFAETPLECLGEKYAAYYPFILLAFVLWFEAKITAAMIGLLMLVVASISVAPGLCPALALFMLMAVFKRWISFGEFIRMSVYCFAVIMFFGFFYSYFGVSDNAYTAHGVSYYSDLTTLSLQPLKVFAAEFIVRIWKQPFLFAFLHLPFLLLAFWLGVTGKPVFKQIFWMVLLIYFSSLVMYGVFYKVFDAVQFYVNNLVFVNVFFILTLTVYFVQVNKFSRVYRLIGLLFVMMLGLKGYFAFTDLKINSSRNQFYSQNYLDAIKKISDTLNDKQLVAAFFGGGQDEMDVRNADKSGVNALHLACLPQFLPAADVSVFDIQYWNSEKEVAEVQKLSVAQTPFARYVDQQKKEGSFNSIEESQLGFLLEKQIHYLVISAKSKPNAFIGKLVDVSIKDDKSGECFVHLKY